MRPIGAEAAVTLVVTPELARPADWWHPLCQSRYIPTTAGTGALLRRANSNPPRDGGGLARQGAQLRTDPRKTATRPTSKRTEPARRCRGDRGQPLNAVATRAGHWQPRSPDGEQAGALAWRRP